MTTEHLKVPDLQSSSWLLKGVRSHGVWLSGRCATNATY